MRLFRESAADAQKREEKSAKLQISSFFLFLPPSLPDRRRGDILILDRRRRLAGGGGLWVSCGGIGCSQFRFRYGFDKGPSYSSNGGLTEGAQLSSSMLCLAPGPFSTRRSGVASSSSSSLHNNFWPLKCLLPFPDVTGEKRNRQLYTQKHRGNCADA